ncbi:helix-turn-helix domain-containing protein [uncultured Psychrobacter sp.]|uniref:helix-turn-helix domain-containing protein n=1 Tax=uncultured Psychrobacter sp. TaxID=259303 RepID=UPI00345A1AFE
MNDFISLDDYLAKMPADSQNRINDKAKRLSQSIELAKLRQMSNLKQTELAKMMGVSQASISKVESGKDIQLSTLQNYVQSLGGEVVITAKMPDGEVILM